VILDEFPAATLSFGPAEQELRARIRAWIADNDPGPPPENFEARLDALREWQQALHAAGFVGLSWPERYGGSGLDLAAEAVLAEELASSGMPELINRIGVYMVGPTLMDLASAEQCERHLPAMLDASELWCQGFSEPEAGSDLAAVRTFGRLDGDELVVNGQKVWTSRAHTARYCSLLVRTDRDEARHRGLSMLILDMEAPGVTVAALPQILNERHFNEVFLDDVRVPVAHAIGGLGQGWKVAMQMLSYERGLFVLERQIRLRRRLDELVNQLGEAGRDDDPAICERVGALHTQLELLKAQVYRTLAAQRAGTLRPGATSVDKLLMSRVYQELFAVAADALGPEVALGMNDWTHDLLDSRATSIYSGTSEIQLNIVSRQLLGLEAAR
jgi:alkylation response protein AidB-like acyl-CoA dehydrogenase